MDSCWVCLVPSVPDPTTSASASAATGRVRLYTLNGKDFVTIYHMLILQASSYVIPDPTMLHYFLLITELNSGIGGATKSAFSVNRQQQTARSCRRRFVAHRWVD